MPQICHSTYFVHIATWIRSKRRQHWHPLCSHIIGKLAHFSEICFFRPGPKWNVVSTCSGNEKKYRYFQEAYVARITSIAAVLQEGRIELLVVPVTADETFNAILVNATPS